MGRGQYQCKVDINQPEILEKLREAGISYKPVHIVKGFADIIVGYKGINYIFEIKQTPKNKLTDDEAKFHKKWNGQISIVYSFEDIMKILELD